MRNALFLLLSIILIPLFSNGQEALFPIRDSLRGLIDNAATPSEKLDIIFENVYYYDFAPFTMEFISEADQLANDHSLPDKQVEVLLTYGQYHNFSSNYDSSQIYLDQALALPFIDDHISLKAELYEAKAVAHNRSDEYQKGIEYFNKSLNLLEDPISKEKYIAKEGEIDLLKMKSIIHNNLGNLYKKIGEYDDAIEEYDQGVKIMMDLEAPRYAATVVMNKASALIDQEEYEKALEVHLQAKKLKVDNDATGRTVAFSDFNIGMCLGHLGRLEEGFNYINEAHDVFQSIDNTKGISQSLAERGIIQNKMGRYEAAISDCEESKKILDNEKITDYADRVYQCLYQANKNNGNYQEALIHLEYLKALKDSTLNAENYRKIGQLESEYKYDLESAINDVKISEERRLNRLKQYGLIATLIGLGLITFLLFKNYRTTKKSEQVLSEKNAIISKALKEKETLLREIHHRVKNNLQFISSLLGLQTEHVKDKVALGALEEGQNRVQSMALIHQNLYQEDNLTGVDMKEYFTKLTRGLFDSYNIRREQIQLELDIENVNLDVDSVIPIGLIVNELVSNSLKYAFPNKRAGIIKVGLKESSNKLILKVEDNGIGISTQLEKELGSSFGYRLINVFKDQMKGDLKIDGSDGTKVVMEISKYECA